MKGAGTVRRNGLEGSCRLRLSARTTKTLDLYALGEHNGWDAEDVRAFLQCEREPSKKMLREMGAM